jgi:hypothetical protein
MSRLFCLGCVIGLGLLLPAGSLPAQEKAKEKAAKKPSRPALPPYVGDVVGEDQKEKLYKVAEQYEAELDKLRAEIRKLNAELQKIQQKRDGEINGLLTDEQKGRIKELAAAAKAKSAANKKAKESAKSAGEKGKDAAKAPAKESAAAAKP